MSKKKHIVISFLIVLIMSIALPACASAASSTFTMFVNTKKTLKLSKTTGTVRWTSSNNSVATVTTLGGSVAARKKGTTTIRASVNGKTYTCTVVVKQPVTSITLNKTSYSLTAGKTFQLTETVKPSSANNKNVTWSSSNTKVAKVSSNGLVTAVAAGTATITAKANDGSGIKTTCKITVNKTSSTTATTTTTSTSTTTTSSTRAARITKFLGYLEKYSSRVESDRKKGIDWFYSNSKPSKTFDDAINNKRYVANCALIATWALKDMGILSYKQCIYGESSGAIHYSGNCESAIKSKCSVISANKSIATLVAEGKIISGDILIYKGHTNIFIGYNKSTGVYSFYDAGRNGVTGSSSNGAYHFNTFKLTMNSGGNVPTYIIRIN